MDQKWLNRRLPSQVQEIVGAADQAKDAAKGLNAMQKVLSSGSSIEYTFKSMSDAKTFSERLDKVNVKYKLSKHQPVVVVRTK